MRLNLAVVGTDYGDVRPILARPETVIGVRFRFIFMVCWTAEVKDLL